MRDSRPGALAALVLAACAWAAVTSEGGCSSPDGSGGGSPQESARFARERERMVRETIEERGVRDPLTLAAMRKVPRHLFVPPESLGQAYADHPLSIGHGQTISQPYIVAFMTEALGLKGGETVIEIGTGCGYQAAVLSEIAAKVYSIEILAPLAEEARERLRRLGYANVEVRVGDGYRGWPEAGPFDGILVTAAAPQIPAPLKDQLKEGGRMIVPVGNEDQDLILVTRRHGAFEQRRILPVRFVPMTGEVRR
jgi:protein-L-isoaspartate(D-aspartate) O-methyltransferase